MPSFKVYEARLQKQTEALDIEAADAQSAALEFQTRMELTGTARQIEIAVIDANGIEHVFGYKEKTPYAPSDD